MAVQTAQPQRALVTCTMRRTASNASPLESEKPNFWSSCAVAMNSCVCASTPTVTRTSTGATTLEPVGDGCDPLDLVERVDDDPRDPVTQRRLDLVDALVVAVHADEVTGNAGADGDGKLPTGTDVEVQSLLEHPPGDLGAEEGLARVEDVGAAQRQRRRRRRSA